eukprot:5718264-Amphidinium_carterae.1
MERASSWESLSSNCSALLEGQLSHNQSLVVCRGSGESVLVMPCPSCNEVGGCLEAVDDHIR